MDGSRLYILFLAIFLLCSAVYAEEYSPGDVLVYFKDYVDESEADELVKSYDLDWVSFFPGENETGVKFGLVKVPVGQENRWLSTFQGDARVSRVERNKLESSVEMQPPSPGSIEHEGIELATIPASSKPAEFDYRDYFVIFGVAAFVVLIFSLILLSRKRKPEAA